MSDKQAGQTSLRKPSLNKNIKKLRAISMVCGLTSSWQQWVKENEKKQSSEPSGWAPSSVGGPTEDTKWKWVPKTPPATQSTETSKTQVIGSGEVQKKEEPKAKDTPVERHYKEKHVVKKVDEPKAEVPPVVIHNKKNHVVKVDEPKAEELPAETHNKEKHVLKTVDELKTEVPSDESHVQMKNMKKVDEPKAEVPPVETHNQEEYVVKKVDEPKAEVPPDESHIEAKTMVKKVDEPKVEELPVESHIKAKPVVEKLDELKAEESQTESHMQEKHVVKKVEKGASNIELLTEKIKESLSSEDEIDRLLKRKSSPTRRRKCSNMVSALTKSWKQVEQQRMPGKEGGEHQKEVGGPCGGESDNKETAKAEDPQKKEEKKAEKKDGGKESEEESESAVKIKRSTVSTYKKEAEDANKINALSKKYSTVGNLKSRWQNWASEHTVNQKLNPFSEYFDYEYSMSLRLQKGQEGYGRPKEGTQTAARAKRAEQHIHREIDDMCYVIRTMADPDPDGKTRVTFGQLFDRYVRISDKVVGILMRARKHGKVAFEGEMLWQGQDDAVIITLLV